MAAKAGQISQAEVTRKMTTQNGNVLDSQEGRQLLNEAAYALVREEAPAELPLYVSTRDRYMVDPEHFLTPPDSKDEALDFGVDVTVDSFTQVVFPVLTPILTYVVNEVAKVVKEQAGKSAAKQVKQLLSDSEPQALFTQDQLSIINEEISHIADAEARRMGLKKSEVLIVRDAVIRRLALSAA
jgi:hypothetical protein